LKIIKGFVDINKLSLTCSMILLWTYTGCRVMFLVWFRI